MSNAPPLPPVPLDRLAEAHAEFERAYPVLLRVFRWYTRGVHCSQTRDDLVQEAAAYCWRVCLFRIGHLAGPTVPLKACARLAILHSLAGRGLCGQEGARDVLSPRASRMGRVRLTHFLSPLSGEGHDLGGEPVAQPGTDPARLVMFRLDYAAWLRTLPRQQRRIARRLAAGDTTNECAKYFGVCASAISQTRRRLLDSWEAFTSR